MSFLFSVENLKKKCFQLVSCGLCVIIQLMALRSVFPLIYCLMLSGDSSSSSSSSDSSSGVYLHDK